MLGSNSTRRSLFGGEAGCCNRVGASDRSRGSPWLPPRTRAPWPPRNSAIRVRPLVFACASSFLASATRSSSARNAMPNARFKFSSSARLIQCSRIGMADMASVTHQFAFIDFPHHAMAVRTGEYRASADAIHFTHAATSTACDIDFILQVVGDRHRLTRGLPHQFIEQRRHAREADHVVRLRTDQGRRRHFRKRRVARSCTTVMPPDRFSADRPAAPSPSVPVENGADGPRPAA